VGLRLRLEISCAGLTGAAHRALSNAEENVQGDCWQGTTGFAAARALRPYLPLLPDLGIAQAKGLAVLPFRTACAPVPRLAAGRASRPWQNPADRQDAVAGWCSTGAYALSGYGRENGDSTRGCGPPGSADMH